MQPKKDLSWYSIPPTTHPAFFFFAFKVACILLLISVQIVICFNLKMQNWFGEGDKYY